MIGVLAMVFTLWFCFPQHWRKLPHFKRRMKYLSFPQIFILLMSIEYWILSWVFFVMPLQYQWILAFVLPFTREVGGTLLTRISIHFNYHQNCPFFLNKQIPHKLCQILYTNPAVSDYKSIPITALLG